MQELLKAGWLDWLVPIFILLFLYGILLILLMIPLFFYGLSKEKNNNKEFKNSMLALIKHGDLDVDDILRHYHMIYKDNNWWVNLFVSRPFRDINYRLKLLLDRMIFEYVTEDKDNYQKVKVMLLQVISALDTNKMLNQLDVDEKNIISEILSLTPEGSKALAIKKMDDLARSIIKKNDEINLLRKKKYLAWVVSFITIVSSLLTLYLGFKEIF